MRSYRFSTLLAHKPNRNEPASDLRKAERVRVYRVGRPYFLVVDNSEASFPSHKGVSRHQNPENATNLCIARRSVGMPAIVSGQGARHRPEMPIFSLAVHPPLLTNYFLHFRVVSILMYYHRYRALVAELRPCRRAYGSTQLLEVRYSNRTHSRSVQGQCQRNIPG
jgi:hypothetical protein